MTVHYNPGDRMNQFRSGLNINYYGNGNGCKGPSTGEALGSIGLSIFGQTLDVLGAAFLYNSVGGGGGASAPSSKQISNSASIALKEMPGKIAAKVTDFNLKYGTAGITIDAKGNVSQSYDDRKAAIEKEIETQTALVKDKDGNTYTNYKDYAKAKQVADSLNNAKTAVNTFNSQIENSKGTLNNYKNLNNSLTFDAKGRCTTEITEASINANNFKQYVTGKKQGDEITEAEAKSTQAFQNAVNDLKNMVEAHNKLVESKENALKGLKDIDGNPVTEDGLDCAITKATDKVNELGTKNIDDTNVKTTCGDRDSRLETLKKQLSTLGTKTDFDAAVNEIKNMDNVLESARTAQSEEQDVSEAKAAVKNTRRKGGFLGLGRLFGTTSKNRIGQDYDKAAHKEAKTNRAAQIGQREDAYEKYLEAVAKLYGS